MKKVLSLALAVLLLLALGGTAFAAPVQLSSADADNQLSFIYSRLADMKQTEDKAAWSYAVTDLDHNGRLELIAASEHRTNHSTNLVAWEVNKSCTTMLKCVVKLEEDESFPDIISENADTFHDEKGDTWHYLFYDNVVLSDREAYAVKCSVTLKNRNLSFEQYAVEHVVTGKGSQTVTYADMNGKEITADEFNAAGIAAFPEKDRSSTNIDWFAYDEASLTRLTDSYAVFVGEKQPAKPAPAPKPQPGPAFLMITKNPTNEVHYTGETAWFVANANTWDTLNWTFVGPNGVEYSSTDFANYYPGCQVGGAAGTTLSISNVSTAMDGFGVYCTFCYQGQTARTSTAWLSVSDNPGPPPTKYISGVVSDAMMSTVTITLDDGTVVQPLKDNCDIDGELAVGCPCDVYYQGDAPYTGNLTYIYIHGNEPQPTYGTVTGSVEDATMNFVTVDLDTGYSITVSQSVVNMVYGDLTIGSSCTAYYYGDHATDDNVYELDVYGSDPGPEPEPPEPTGGSMYGTVSDATMNFVTISLENGDSVTVSQRLVTVNFGGLAIGDYATVYYNGDAPTEANIYSVEVSGRLYDDADNDDADNDDSGDDDGGGDAPHPWLYSSNG
ncbi:MAG: hypothetical protein K6F56_07970 [Oscillospiraceae bacterium]|nr:hypothetical protein [Oscillospiraceae bacterium]